MTGRQQHKFSFQINPWPVILFPHALVLGVTIASWLQWMHGGTDGALIAWMRAPGMIVLLASPLAELAFCVIAWRSFAPAQRSRRTWILLGMGAFLRFVGTLLFQWLPVLGFVDFPTATPQFGDLRWFGYFLAGNVSLAMYAAGLLSAWSTYRRLGFSEPMRLFDWLWLLLGALFVAHETGTLMLHHRDQLAHPANWNNWITDPLLLFLLLISLRLSSAAGGTQGGLTGRAWFCYSLAFRFMLLANLGEWLFVMGYLNWIASSPIRWFLWYPAAASFLSGACCQWQAVVALRRTEAGTSAFPLSESQT